MTTAKSKTGKTSATTKKRAKAPAGVRTKKAKQSKPSDEERYQWIEYAAYIRAEQRGFQNGSPEDDWFAAEQEINAKIS